MTKPRACKICNKIYEGDKCPDCGISEFTESFKGKIIVIDPERSEIVKKLNIKNKGNFALKTK